MNKSLIKAGFIAGIPICIGYFPVAMAFGLLAKTTGGSLGEALGFSVFVFAGASQFMALNLLHHGVSHLEIIIATLLLNFRHFLMSATIASRLDGAKRRFLPLLAFGVTDESFAVAATREGKLNAVYLIPLEFSAYSAWALGTVAGFLMGAALPKVLQKSMGIGLYAMFVAILGPGVKRRVQFGLLALAAGVCHSLLAWVQWLLSGWNIIAAILIVTAVGAWLMEDMEKGAEQE